MTLIEIDNLLLLSRQEANLIINTAKLKSAEIISDAYLKIPDIVDKTEESVISPDNKTSLKRVSELPN